MFNDLFEYLQNNNIISIYQSGFRPGNSCVSHLISVTVHLTVDHLWKSLDISKAFGIVWHKGLLFKIEKLRYWWKPVWQYWKFSKKPQTKSSPQWKIFIMGKCYYGSTARFRSRSFAFSAIYLPDYLNSVAKLFADDTSIFQLFLMIKE